MRRSPWPPQAGEVAGQPRPRRRRRPLPRLLSPMIGLASAAAPCTARAALTTVLPQIVAQQLPPGETEAAPPHQHSSLATFMLSGGLGQGSIPTLTPRERSLLADLDWRRWGLGSWPPGNQQGPLVGTARGGTATGGTNATASSVEVFLRKLKKATEKKNFETVERLRQNKPKYSLDHIVRERYPTFIDAIRDLEDCLCLCFLYSTFPKTQKTPVEMTTLCRRLTTEFMHFVIESKALRKVFCSIKGYYFQAEIKGQTVTWVIPHSFGFVQPAEVDMRLMSIFVEFYTTVLGFVNFRLFHSLNLTYPPKLATVTEAGDADMEDRVGALNQSLQRTVVEEEDNNEPIENIANVDEEKMKEAVKEREMKDKQSNLFNGLKFFLGREVPREPLVFMIRAVGGEVSWDASVGPGATFDSSDPGITHQVMDRNASTVGNTVLGRFYLQPQWIFDSINQRERCPEKDYALGETLPPHLSPFVSERERRVGDYVPPEQKALEEGAKPEEEEEDEESDEEEEEDSGNEDDSGEEEEEEKSEEQDKAMAVSVGMMEKLDEDHEKKMEEDEEYRLRVMMIKKKHRGLYRSMMKNRRKRVNESKLKEKKRKEWEEENTPKPKKKKTTA